MKKSKGKESVSLNTCKVFTGTIDDDYDIVLGLGSHGREDSVQRDWLLKIRCPQRIRVLVLGRTVAAYLGVLKLEFELRQFFPFHL